METHSLTPLWKPSWGLIIAGSYSTSSFVAPFEIFRLLYFATDGAASLFRWSADGKYLARKGKDLISIYELPSMRLLDKKSLKVRP